MFIIGILVVIGFVSSVICSKVFNDVNIHNKVLEYTMISSSLIISVGSFITAIILGIMILITHNGYFKEQKKLEYDVRYKTIMSVIDDGCRYNTTEELVKMIAEYNGDVLKGRETMKNPWFKDFDYDFYEDLEVIEIGRRGEK